MLARIYIKSVALLLIVTAVGKAIMAFEGSAAVLDTASPLFVSISIRQLLFITAALESAVTVLVLSGWGGQRLALTAIAWLGAMFLGYRVMLWGVGFHGYCDCLGNASGALGISPETANQISLGILVYFLMGSLVLLLRLMIFGLTRPSVDCRVPQLKDVGSITRPPYGSREISPTQE